MVSKHQICCKKVIFLIFMRLIGLASMFIFDVGLGWKGSNLDVSRVVGACDLIYRLMMVFIESCSLIVFIVFLDWAFGGGVLWKSLMLCLLMINHIEWIGVVYSDVKLCSGVVDLRYSLRDIYGVFIISNFDSIANNSLKIVHYKLFVVVRENPPTAYCLEIQRV